MKRKNPLSNNEVVFAKWLRYDIVKDSRSHFGTCMLVIYHVFIKGTRFSLF